MIFLCFLIFLYNLNPLKNKYNIIFYHYHKTLNFHKKFKIQNFQGQCNFRFFHFFSKYLFFHSYHYLFSKEFKPSRIYGTNEDIDGNNFIITEITLSELSFGNSDSISIFLF